MRQIININVPTCWQQLSDKQLRFVFKLLMGNLLSANSLRHVFDKYICRKSSDLTVNFSLPQVKALCLLKWTKMKILRREGSIFIMKYNKQTFPVTALQITEVTQSMEWLGDFPVYPVRLSRIGLHRPIQSRKSPSPWNGWATSLSILYVSHVSGFTAQYLRTSRECRSAPSSLSTTFIKGISRHANMTSQ